MNGFLLLKNVQCSIVWQIKTSLPFKTNTNMKTFYYDQRIISSFPFKNRISIYLDGATQTLIPLLLLLSYFGRVRLCVTPETAAHQAPLSLGFSRQEHWSGLSSPIVRRNFLLQCVKVKSESEVAQSCPTL